MGVPWALPGDAVVKNLSANIQDLKDAGSTPGLGRSLGVGNGNLLQHSCLENSMDRRVWQLTVHRVTKSQTQLSDWAHMGTQKWTVNSD